MWLDRRVCFIVFLKDKQREVLLIYGSLLNIGVIRTV